MKKWIKLSCMVALLGSTCFVYAEVKPNEALQFVRERAAASQFPEAYVAFKNKDYPKALDIYKHFAEQGNPVAQFMLGYFNRNGLGVPSDKLLAVAWYMKANTQGLPEAMYALGLMYFY